MTSRPRFLAALTVLLAAWAAVTIRDAWVGDDAYITFRTIDNLVSGFGLRYNVAERVQTYTHPLWMFLLAAPYAITREAFYTSLAVSFLVSLAALLVVALRVAWTPPAALLAVGVLALSKAFVDYSTSGLENPLTHLLLALLCAEFFRRRGEAESPTRLALLSSLLALTRMDTFLFALPVLASVLLADRSTRTLGRLALGLVPLGAWAAFSFVYYGTPFPNTAYAKLHTGIPRLELAVQGLHYLGHSFRVDPITPLTIGGALVAALATRRRRDLAVAAGLLLYVAYVVSIGGCFMSGRLLSAPLVAAVILGSRLHWTPRRAVPVAVAAIALGLVSAYSPLRATAAYGGETERSQFPRGIVDERGWYFPAAGFVHVFPGPGVPRHRYTVRGLRTTKAVEVTYTLGYLGYFAPRGTHVIDTYALADPLLARLPIDRSEPWRIGHFMRPIPAGYVETLESGHNRIEDPKLAEYHDVVAYVTRGPLLDGRRILTALRWNLGAYDSLLDAYWRETSRPFPVRSR